MTQFCEQVLGKGVVICKDVPNFIGNRIGVFDISNAVRPHGREEPEGSTRSDAIIGKALGRPGTAIFGTLDLVGLDTGYHVMTNLYAAVPDDEMREMFVPREFMNKMMELKWLGQQDQAGLLQEDEGRQGQEGQAHARLPHHGVCAGRTSPSSPPSPTPRRRPMRASPHTIKVMFNGNGHRRQR
ncbi:MAG: 3-hydroxyacyl-CoA dehydrogenase family protein [Rhodopseudomonas palustris]|nr:3-hydroxyacyl-CoA dehydrogenase family protein [Rhodopseudomonas palustris]